MVSSSGRQSGPSTLKLTTATSKQINLLSKFCFEKLKWEVLRGTEVAHWIGVTRCLCSAPSFSPGAQLCHHCSDWCWSGLHCPPQPHAADDCRCVSCPSHPRHPAGTHQCPGDPASTNQCPGHSASTNWDTRTPPRCTNWHTGTAASTNQCSAATSRHQDFR